MLFFNTPQPFPERSGGLSIGPKDGAHRSTMQVLTNLGTLELVLEGPREVTLPCICGGFPARGVSHQLC